MHILYMSSVCGLQRAQHCKSKEERVFPAACISSLKQAGS